MTQTSTIRRGRFTFVEREDGVVVVTNVHGVPLDIVAATDPGLAGKTLGEFVTEWIEAWDSNQ